MPLPVRTRLWVALSFTTGLSVSALGTAPTMIGRSGSPLTCPITTSVPMWSGKWKPYALPALGCAARTQREA